MRKLEKNRKIYSTITPSSYSKLDKFAKKNHMHTGSASSLVLEKVIKNFKLEKIISSKPNNSLKKSKRVFIVHGRDNKTKELMRKFLLSIGIEPIILHEQPNEGKSILDKLQKQSEFVSYAIILLTPDDFGSFQEDQPRLMNRARQNVIFELGFFISKLGSENVSAINKGVQIPSDYEGIVYIPMKSNSDNWKEKLIEELISAKIIPKKTHLSKKGENSIVKLRKDGFDIQSKKMKTKDETLNVSFGGQIFQLRKDKSGKIILEVVE